MAQSTTVEGRTIGRYRVSKHLATGGMAEIYLATYDDRGHDRTAVVKVILRERARDRKFVQMFLDEARVASTLLHPNIAQLYEVGRDGDTYFYAMEYVAGDNARALIERSLRARVYMPVPVTLAIGTRVAAALHYAHERSSSSGQQLNAVHRDVTPANIMLAYDGAVKLLDFGIARADSRAAMTQSGTVKGKFAYMSPEQCLGAAVDRRTDVFALGIVLYELSTQRRAFRAATDFDTMQRILRGELVPPRRIHATYPRELEEILLRALAPEPRDRYQTAAELGQALLGYQRAIGVAADEHDVAAIMGELFPAEAPPRPASDPALVVPPPAMSLASMLAATVEPVAVATPAWSRPPSTMVPLPPTPRPTPPPMTTLVGAMAPVSTSAAGPPLAPTSPMGAVPPPMTTLVTAPPAPTTSPMGAVPPPVRGRRPVTGPAAFAPSASRPAIAQAPALEPAPAAVARYAPPALGTPPGMAQVTPDDELAAEFARASAELEAVAGDDELTNVEQRAASRDDEQTGVELPAVAVARTPTPVPMPGHVRVPAPVHALVAPRPYPHAVAGATIADQPEAERDRLGLWLALAAIFAVGAVVAAVLVFSSIGF